MTAREIIDAIREIMARHTGGEAELLEELMAEAEGWKMRLQELEDESSDDL